MKGLLLALLFLVLVVILGATYKNPKLVNYLRDQYLKSNTSSSSTPTPTPTKKSPEIQMYIYLNSNGFSPEVLTISTNTKVVWTNKTNKSINIVNNSTNNKFDIGTINANASKGIVFDVPGTYIYHNNSNSQQIVTVIVEK